MCGHPPPPSAPRCQCGWGSATGSWRELPKRTSRTCTSCNQASEVRGTICHVLLIEAVPNAHMEPEQSSRTGEKRFMILKPWQTWEVVKLLILQKTNVQIKSTSLQILRWKWKVSADHGNRPKKFFIKEKQKTYRYGALISFLSYKSNLIPLMLCLHLTTTKSFQICSNYIIIAYPPVPSIISLKVQDGGFSWNLELGKVLQKTPKCGSVLDACPPRSLLQEHLVRTECWETVEHWTHSGVFLKAKAPLACRYKYLHATDSPPQM